MYNGDKSFQPNHVSHWINSNISTEEFIELLRRDSTRGVDAAEPTAMLKDLSNKMSEMLVGSDSGSDAAYSGTGDGTTLPRFDLPWANLETYAEPSLYLTNNNRNPLTSYSSSSVRHKACTTVGGHSTSRTRTNMGE